MSVISSASKASEKAPTYGSFVLMLHSHLPFYRKAGMWPFGEENLYECMAETYMPLVKALEELLKEGIRAHITVGITPILAEQLADSHLQQGFVNYLKQLIKAAEDDLARYADSPKSDTRPDTSANIPHAAHKHFVAQFYHQHFKKLLDDFEHRYGRDLIAAFRRLQDAGAIEITTSGATHGFSPLLGQDASVNAQFKVGVETYKKYFGKAPTGCWLPECAYRNALETKDPVTGHPLVRPPVDAFLFENDLQYFFTESHAIEGGMPVGARRMVGIYGNVQYIPMPSRLPTGFSTYEAYWLKDYPVAVMGRNDRASFQVWSAAHGYPGDGGYREFHKRDSESGLHYWRITSKDCDLGDKMLYDPIQAFNHVASQADHFVALVHDLLKARYDSTGEPSLLMVSFDTELFGHWWFEGVSWIKAIIQRLHACQPVQLQTAAEYLADYPPKQAMHLPDSTWGQGGHFWVWKNQHTEWMWPIIHKAEEKMCELVARFDPQSNAFQKDAVVTRVLNQAFRELLLLQSSDWPFLVTTFQAKDYAIERFETHRDNFWQLATQLDSANLQLDVLEKLEEQNNPFANIDYRWYRPAVRVPQPTLEVNLQSIG